MATAVLQPEDTRDLALRLRRHAVRMCSSGGSAHVGSCLSMADIIAVLFGEILRIDPHEPRWPGRDRFILSKGHAGACIYAALAERGFFPVRELAGHYRNGSRFSGHVSSKGIPGVEVSTGSLGHGLGLAVGVAMQLRRQGGDRRTFVLMSDGECDEGSVWEAALFASQHRLGQLCAIIDFNNLQGLAPVAETVALEPFGAKWRAFGWRVLRIDGHDHAALREALSTQSTPGDRPLCIIADTVKGKGVSFMENQVLWHYRIPAGDEFAAALRELGDTERARDA